MVFRMIKAISYSGTKKHVNITITLCRSQSSIKEIIEVNMYMINTIYSSQIYLLLKWFYNNFCDLPGETEATMIMLLSSEIENYYTPKNLTSTFFKDYLFTLKWKDIFLQLKGYFFLYINYKFLPDFLTLVLQLFYIKYSIITKYAWQERNEPLQNLK